jgi:hypothetical protein
MTMLDSGTGKSCRRATRIDLRAVSGAQVTREEREAGLPQFRIPGTYCENVVRLKSDG